MKPRNIELQREHIVRWHGGLWASVTDRQTVAQFADALSRWWGPDCAEKCWTCLTCEGELKSKKPPSTYLFITSGVQHRDAPHKFVVFGICFRCQGHSDAFLRQQGLQKLSLVGHDGRSVEHDVVPPMTGREPEHARPIENKSKPDDE